MNAIRYIKLFTGCTFFWIISCSSPEKSAPALQAAHESGAFKQYWYFGKAEITTYNLKQSRYGEVRDGKAVLIFVTEDFSIHKQVKLDDPEKAGEDKISVLKMNFTKNFVTGIYPYSMMLSTFTAVDQIQNPHSLKTTMSSQEWCGQVFAQLNLRGKKFHLQSNSYFEKEGDMESQLNAVLLEDELWNLIRLHPESLPEGNVEILPGLFFTRLMHEHILPTKAVLSKENQNDTVRYSVSFPEQKRALTISFKNSFPSQITGWEETFEERGKQVKTVATIDKTMQTDYWTKNKNEFLHLRDSLGLSHSNF